MGTLERESGTEAGTSAVAPAPADLQSIRPVRRPHARLGRGGLLGAAILLVIALPCFVTLPWSTARFDDQRLEPGYPLAGPSLAEPMGTDHLGRSMLWRVLLGGSISLGVGLAAAAISVVIGVSVGSIAGYAGGRTDAILMRIVDVLYGLPYVLLVVLFAVMVTGLTDRISAAEVEAAAAAAEQGIAHAPGWLAGAVRDHRPLINLAALVVAIGGVSWLTLARVIRGQVLSLREQMFVEAARAVGVRPLRILRVHLLPNLIGPIVVYTTLTVPAAILQESFLSFLGIGVQPPLPSWGNLASDALGEVYKFGQNPVTVAWTDFWSAPLATTGTWLAEVGHGVKWWLFVWPCTLLGLTLLALNYLGDALRARLDPRTGKRG